MHDRRTVHLSPLRPSLSPTPSLSPLSLFLSLSYSLSLSLSFAPSPLRSLTYTNCSLLRPPASCFLPLIGHPASTHPSFCLLVRTTILLCKGQTCLASGKRKNTALNNTTNDRCRSIVYIHSLDGGCSASRAASTILGSLDGAACSCLVIVNGLQNIYTEGRAAKSLRSRQQLGLLFDGGRKNSAARWTTKGRAPSSITEHRSDAVSTGTDGAAARGR